MIFFVLLDVNVLGYDINVLFPNRSPWEKVETLLPEMNGAQASVFEKTKQITGEAKVQLSLRATGFEIDQMRGEK